MENNIYFQVGIVLLIGLSAKTAILMTAFFFVLGVIPLVIASGAGARSRVSLGIAVAGGMLVFTILGGLLHTGPLMRPWNRPCTDGERILRSPPRRRPRPLEASRSNNALQVTRQAVPASLLRPFDT